MPEINFGGAIPDDDRETLISQLIDVTLLYAADARYRGRLHASKRIAVVVPADAARRPLFEAAEARLWEQGVRLDWSAFQSWSVPHHLADGFDPLDLLVYSESDGWRIAPDKENFPADVGTADEIRALAARLLATADAADEHNRMMPAPTTQQDQQGA